MPMLARSTVGALLAENDPIEIDFPSLGSRPDSEPEPDAHAAEEEDSDFSWLEMAFADDEPVDVEELVAQTDEPDPDPLPEEAIEALAEALDAETESDQSPGSVTESNAGVEHDLEPTTEPVEESVEDITTVLTDLPPDLPEVELLHDGEPSDSLDATMDTGTEELDVHEAVAQLAVGDLDALKGLQATDGVATDTEGIGEDLASLLGDQPSFPTEPDQASASEEEALQAAADEPPDSEDVEQGDESATSSAPRRSGLREELLGTFSQLYGKH